MFSPHYSRFDVCRIHTTWFLHTCFNINMHRFHSYGSPKEIRYRQNTPKHGMIISALSWLWACIICGLVLYIVTDIHIIDAVFESMSALTGSGITIYSDVESLPHSILFFRALQQWIGRLGIIVMIISFLIKPGTASYTLYQSEAREDQLKPSTNSTIKESFKIYSIYIPVLELLRIRLQECPFLIQFAIHSALSQLEE